MGVAPSSLLGLPRRRRIGLALPDALAPTTRNIASEYQVLRLISIVLRFKILRFRRVIRDAVTPILSTASDLTCHGV